MQLLFVDESGTPPPPSKKTTNTFVLSGVVIPDGIWHNVNNDIKNLKQQFGVEGEIKWRYFSPHNKDKENPFIYRSWEDKKDFRNEFLQTISKYKSLKIIASYTNVEDAYTHPYINNENDIYWYCYKGLVERFQYYLQDVSRSFGTKQSGMIICDHRESSQDVRLRNLHQNMLNSGGWYTSRYENFIETLLFAPSHMSTGVQIADMVAGCVFRYTEKQDSTFLNMIKGMFRKSESGEINGYGLVRVPKKKTLG